MFTRRATAVKVLIKDLLNNEFVRREGEASYVTVNGVNVSRVNIIATIVNKYVNNERHSGTIIIDDGSEVISVRAWENEFHLIDNLVIGDLVMIIGKVRMYNEELYLTPEIIKKVSGDWLVLRKLELRKADVAPEPKPVDEVDSSIKESVFNLIKSKGDEGVLMDELVSLVGDKLSCQNILKELLEEDLIFEPRAGKYKVL